MTSRIAAIVRAMAVGRQTRCAAEDVHFHSDSRGVYVCDNSRCDSPGVDVSRDC